MDPSILVMWNDMLCIGGQIACDKLNSSKKRSSMFNSFSVCRMRNPKNMIAWGIFSSLSDYARGVKDINLCLLCYHGLHAMLTSLHWDINKARGYVHAARYHAL